MNNIIKSFFIFLLLTIFSNFVIATEKIDYKQELLDRGYLYGCTPANWKITEPLRGGFNYAALNNELEIMDLEVKAGLDITQCGASLPRILIYKKQNQALDFLMNNGYNPNGEFLKSTYLWNAINFKNQEAVNILIKHGADVNKTNKKLTPLNYAIKKKNIDIVKSLLNAGAKPDEKTQELLKKSKMEL